ncbi:hypothetical protein N7475_003553 [Penicillium sp. IBT 31633x]|nr:hypothetical protein N7475_003553 [Penicillium sp. IBT 31633x]
MFFVFILLATIYVRTSLGGTLNVVDYDGKCVIWSDDNHGCTGSSAIFGLLDGDDCSDISKVTDGTRKEYSVLNVDTCGTEKDRPVAWIQINKNGLVTFFNQNGNIAACTLDNGLKVGSWCSASDSLSTTSLSVSSASTSSDSLSTVSSAPKSPKPFSSRSTSSSPSKSSPSGDGLSSASSTDLLGACTAT